jgi:hypothetical protein
MMTMHTVETVDVLLPLTGPTGEPLTVQAKVAARRSDVVQHRDAVKAAKRHLRRTRSLAALRAVQALWRWASPQDKVAAQVATVLTRDFVRAQLEQRAAEGDAFAAMALAAHQ